MTVRIHWFRRDLRLTDNPALCEAARDGAPVIPVYILSDWKSAHRWTGPNRQHFLCGCLKSLAANLKTIGGRLVIRQGDPVAELLGLASETGATEITYSRDPDPFGRAVEERLEEAARPLGIICRSVKDVCMHERREVLNGSGEPFRVFTPYSKAWAKAPHPSVRSKPRALRTPAGIPSNPLPALAHWGLRDPAGGLPEPGEKAARKRLDDFLTTRLAGYGENRNLPAGKSTSRLSQDLRFGLLSIREVFERVTECANELPPVGRDSAAKFASELVWREFYMQILWHFPEVLESEFNPTFRGMRWPGTPSHFELWKSGETGFPIVDAAMRELRETGFMHNRTRMIAAMFLTKDLHLDWRLGESFFMQSLVDGEIASNNGGWQWSAGTGADAAPYFRIQNPWTQTRRYDPQGAYIKTWIPELRDVDPVRLCDPPDPGLRLAKGYPLPIVDHSRARDITLDLFAAHKKAQ